MQTDKAGGAEVSFFLLYISAGFPRSLWVNINMT